MLHTRRNKSLNKVSFEVSCGSIGEFNSMRIGSSWKNSVQDVAMLCNTEPQVEPCFQWSLGYEAPWLRHAFAARAALARQLCNKSTNDIR